MQLLESVTLCNKLLWFYFLSHLTETIWDKDTALLTMYTSESISVAKWFRVKELVELFEIGHVTVNILKGF